ncbi:hypothetical protein Tco_0323773 [Tanacetum coccineum]
MPIRSSSKTVGEELETRDSKKRKSRHIMILRADGSSKIYLLFSQLIKSFDREDLETLWKLVKAKHGNTRPEKGYERVLWSNLKTMFEHHVEDLIWRNLQGKKAALTVLVALTLPVGRTRVAGGIFLLGFSFKVLARVVLVHGPSYFTISSLQLDLRSWKLE